MLPDGIPTIESGPIPTAKQVIGQVEDICGEHDDQPGYKCVNHNVPCSKVEQERGFQSFNDLLTVHVNYGCCPTQLLFQLG